MDEAESRREAEVEDAWSMMLVKNELVDSRRARKRCEPIDQLLDYLVNAERRGLSSPSSL